MDTLDSLADGFAQAEARRLPDDPVPTYAFTPSMLDDSLAPPNHHTVYLACPAAPFKVRGGWDTVKEGFAERMIDTVAARVPGFRSTRALSGHGTSVRGLFITGAGTAPVGGIAGSPGRAAAKAVLTWRRRSGR